MSPFGMFNPPEMWLNVVFLHEIITSDDVQICRPLLFVS